MSERQKKALDGEIPARYPLTETRGKGYQTRTKWNVRDSDATLILCHGEPTGGTALTILCCEALNKPFEIFRLSSEWGRYIDGEEHVGLIYWLNVHHVKTLNVAGPREGKYFPIYKQANSFLSELFKLARQENNNIYVAEPATDYIAMPQTYGSEILLHI